MPHGSLSVSLSLVLLLAIGPAAVGQDAPLSPDEWERPWTGLLPDPGQEFGGEDGGGNESFGVRVLDAVTGRPVVGARLTRTPEWIAPWRLRHDVVMSVASTDAEGIAHVPSAEWAWKEDCHWLVTAPGYAPAYEYDEVPDWDVLLEPGETLSARLVDPLGRPVVGGLVEYLSGCSHGTAAAGARTEADGGFVLRDVDVSSGQLWFEGAGIASDLAAADWTWSLGARPGLVVGDPGLRFVGRVVDLLGKPVPRVVVRAYNEQRGPTTSTDAEGRFVLEGAETDSGLYFYSPSELHEYDGARRVDDGHPGVPMTVVLTPLGVPELDETAEVRVFAGRTNGRPVDEVEFALVGVKSGRGPTYSTEKDGFGSVDAAPGSYRVVPSDPWDEVTFDPVTVEARAHGTAEVRVVVRPRPRLRIRGRVPPGAQLVLAVPGADTLRGEHDPEQSWTPALPADGPAALRVDLEGAPPFFFPVGAVADGVRQVDVDVPPPRRIALPAGARNGALFSGPLEIRFRAGETGGELLTWAEGRVTLRYTDADGRTRETDVVLPRDPGGVVEVDGEGARTVVESVAVRLWEWAVDGWVEADSEGASPGEMVVFEQEGMQTLRGVAPAHGELVLRRSPCFLSLRIQEADGEPADALVMVDGEVHAATGGVLELAGLDVGPHRLLVGRRDDGVGGRELRLVLAWMERRSWTITLGEE